MPLNYLKVQRFVLSKGVPLHETIALTSELMDLIKARGWSNEFNVYYAAA